MASSSVPGGSAPLAGTCVVSFHFPLHGHTQVQLYFKPRISCVLVFTLMHIFNDNGGNILKFGSAGLFCNCACSSYSNTLTPLSLSITGTCSLSLPQPEVSKTQFLLNVCNKFAAGDSLSDVLLCCCCLFFFKKT